MAIAAQAEQEAIRKTARMVGAFMTLAYSISGVAALDRCLFTYHPFLCDVNLYLFG
jgi:hypothetical protein